MTPGSCPSDTSAHPRSRGENARYVSPQASSDGSSPLTRGKHLPAYWVPAHAGLIPAHAGKTPQTVSACRRSRAHPRSRGENVEGCFSCHGLIGSSPLTRGKLPEELSIVWRPRLIPAHAGKTSRTVGAAKTPEAHPRSRGENLPISQDRITPSGSSPLTRGKRRPRSRRQRRGRLIPAHAGKTSLVETVASKIGAHPRSRGENDAKYAATFSAVGSSPLTRGKLRDPPGPEPADGLIPAHAGKTRP